MSADRFKQTPKATEFASWNKYSYVSGDPVNQRDPHGQFGCTCDYPDPIDGGPEDGSTGGGGQKGKPGNQGNDPAKVPCIQPAHPGLPDDQIQTMINQAQAVISNAIVNSASPPDPNVNTTGTVALVALLGFLKTQFKEGGAWDYKDAPGVQSGSPTQDQLRTYGNFAFGAVLNGLGFNYYVAQNAAGINQIDICNAGGACGTGVPFLIYPYGDQISDAQVIKKGFDYEQNVQSNNCIKQP